jgi:O-antigen ligase
MLAVNSVTLRLVCATILLTLPWLNPFAWGPSPAVMPWLISVASSAVAAAVVMTLPSQVPDLADLPSNAWLLAGLASTMIGLLQYFGVSEVFSPWVNVTSAGEAFANLRQRNQFASLTNISLVVILCWAGRRGMQGEPVATLSTIALSGAAAMLMVGNAITSSRTGLVQMTAVVLISSWWSARRFPQVRTVAFVAVVVYGFATFSLPLIAGLDPASVGIFARLQDGSPSCASRLTLWSNALNLIGQRPWMGWGWGELDYAHFITLYPGARFCEILDNAHNLPLHLAVELGVPFAVLACALTAWAVWRGAPWTERNSRRQVAWGVLAVIGIHSLLEYPLWYGPFQIALALCVWTLCTTASVPQQQLPRSTKSLPIVKYFSKHPKYYWRLAISIAPVVALVFVAFAGYDYYRISQIYLPPDQRSPEYRVDTMKKIGGFSLFKNQVMFAELTTTKLTVDNAQWVNTLAHSLMPFSPEPSVVAKLIDSARFLGRKEEAVYFEERFQAAYPEAYQQWQARRTRMAQF